MPKVMLHEENAYDRLKSLYRPTAGRQAIQWTGPLYAMMK